ncbi:MAG: TM2 domain-containing membrane protein YozV [Planctomycetota bacterium]|jgi:hypothetical protein
MQRRPNEELPGDPNVALFLTWLLPGAGHLYLGRAAMGLAIMVLVEGLYALGWYLSDGRTFEFLDPELRGAAATVLTPEFGNLGGMVMQMKLVGFGVSTPSPFPANIALGGWLCALSGLVNICFMAHAHLLARTPKAAPRAGLNPALLVGAAWLVPGLGHFLQGRKLRALIVASMLIGLFVAGTLLAEGSNFSRERHFYYWSGQALLGLPALLGEFVSGRPAVTTDIRWADVGLLYASMAGLLSVLTWLDVYSVAERRWLGLDSPKGDTQHADTQHADTQQADAQVSAEVATEVNP